MNLKKILIPFLITSSFVTLGAFANNNNVEDLLIKEVNEQVDYSKMPKLAFLLLNNQEERAIELIKNGTEEPFQKFIYKGSETSDIVIALDNGLMDYLKVAIPKISNRINERYLYDNEEGYYLLMNVAMVKDDKTFAKTNLLLSNGADENLLSKNGYSAFKLANENKNNMFISALYDYKTRIQNPNYNVLFDNVSLFENDRKKQTEILNELRNGKLKELTQDYNKTYDYFTKLIILGYNDAADYLLNSLQNNKDFNVNNLNSNGITPLIAATISYLDGGNVDYFEKLIELGADVNVKSADGYPLEVVAVSKDAFKVFNQLIIHKKDLFADDNLIGYMLQKENPPYRTIFVVDKYVKRTK